MSSSASQRLSLKASNELATREAMTQRRQEWTARIRKAKKDQIIAMKRRYVPPVTHMNDGNDAAMDLGCSIVQLANRAVQNPSLHLEAFQRALSIADTAHKPTPATHEQLKPENLNDPLSLLNILAGVLSDMSMTLALKLTAARALTNLAAIESIHYEDSYYGRVPESWSTLLVKSNMLNAFHQLLTSQSSDELLLQCCWALGNLVGDSHEARVASLFLFPPLVHITMRALEQKKPSLCRNATWAISGLVRGMDQVFCGPDLVTPSLLAQLLVSPERETPAGDDVSWMDAAQEAAWIVAFLTAKDDAAVEYLCSGSTNVSFSSQSPFVVLEALACRLHQSLQHIRQASSWTSEEATQSLKMAIPCLRALGNIASSSHGNHLPALLKAHSKSVVKSLGDLLDLGSMPSSSSHIHLGTASVEAAWAARTFLCDAGLADHESTSIAIPVLLPQLCRCVTSGYGAHELKREALTALWTAAAAPPHSDQSMGSIWSTRSSRDDFLRQIAHAPLMLATLVDLLKTSVDMDVVRTTLQLVDAILRRLADDEGVRREFEENDGLNALEHICDIASSNAHYGEGTDWKAGASPAADIAADLIDDLFSAAQDNDMLDVAPVSDGTTFTFGLPEAVAVNKEGVLPSRGRGRPVPSWMSNGA